MGIYKLAVKMILVHNHPSGEVEPSAADMDLTDHMMKVGQLIKIDVFDHLIISEDKFLSFENEGLMELLAKTGKYEVIDKEKAQLLQWKLDLEKERAEKKRALEIAKKMKVDGLDDDTIKKYTGLNKWDIKKL